MALTQTQIAQQMVAQLRVLDPSVSAEVGTPERKIIDTVAQAIAEAEVDLNLLGGALDLDSKYGQDLANFVGMFGFGRQQGSFATGFVTFGRPTPSAYNITIPRGTQVLGVTTTNVDSVDGASSTVSVTFMTTLAVTLAAGQTSVVAPIQALQTGSLGNVAPNSITQFANLGAPPLGITTVNNTVSTTNGTDAEADAELKVRFRNTVFRNLSGTEDQFLAVAGSSANTTKANVLGPISRYQEYLQIPEFDDSSHDPGHEDGPGNGNEGEWTTTLSGNPYAKYIYTTAPYFASNGQQDIGTVFWRQDVDFVMNAPPLDVGDSHREYIEGDTPNPAAFPNNPNFTFRDVYLGVDPAVQQPRPNDIVLVEYAYMSRESRNDYNRHISNCVDVYVNGGNPTTADAIVSLPSASSPVFNNFSGSPFYYQNFRRIGQPDFAPGLNHLFMALYWEPVIALPDQIVAGTNTYFLNTHYFAIEDVTLLRNTIRSRNGIEWTSLPGVATGGGIGQPISSAGVSSFTVAGYTFDRNIIDLQAAMDGVKQVTTDVLVHRATPRYFKLDVTVVYSPGASSATTNALIQQAVQAFFDGRYFGTIIQLSDLLLTIRSVTGVQNVRWSNDVVNPSDDDANTFHRVTECGVGGLPRLGGTVVFDHDFYLLDSELPTLPGAALDTDTLPGLIIRPRAQNIFSIL